MTEFLKKSCVARKTHSALQCLLSEFLQPLVFTVWRLDQGILCKPCEETLPTAWRWKACQVGGTRPYWRCRRDTKLLKNLTDFLLRSSTTVLVSSSAPGVLGSCICTEDEKCPRDVWIVLFHCLMQWIGHKELSLMAIGIRREVVLHQELLHIPHGFCHLPPMLHNGPVCTVTVAAMFVSFWSFIRDVRIHMLDHRKHCCLNWSGSSTSALVTPGA